MTTIPAFIRNLLVRKQPAPPKCTDENIAALMGRIIRHENNSPPGTMGAQWIENELRRAGDPTPADIARRGEAMTYAADFTYVADFGEGAKYTYPEDKT